MNEERPERSALISRGALLVLGASLVCLCFGQSVDLPRGLVILILSAGLSSIGAFIGLESASRRR